MLLELKWSSYSLIWNCLYCRAKWWWTWWRSRSIPPLFQKRYSVISLTNCTEKAYVINKLVPHSFCFLIAGILLLIQFNTIWFVHFFHVQDETVQTSEDSAINSDAVDTSTAVNDTAVTSADDRSEVQKPPDGRRVKFKTPATVKGYQPPFPPRSCMYPWKSIYLVIQRIHCSNGLPYPGNHRSCGNNFCHLHIFYNIIILRTLCAPKLW